MSDLFHEEVPVEFIQRVFNVTKHANWHRFQMLTKRSDRLLKLDRILPWMSHIWIGVTVENQDYGFRIDHLRKTKISLTSNWYFYKILAISKTLD